MRESRTLTDGAQLPAWFQIPLNPSSLLLGASGHPLCGHKKTEFLVDTGAACSVLTWPANPLSNRDCTVTGASGQPKVGPSPSAFGAGPTIITHSFLYMPECPVSLLGRDLLNNEELGIPR